MPYCTQSSILISSLNYKNFGKLGTLNIAFFFFFNGKVICYLEIITRSRRVLSEPYREMSVMLQNNSTWFCGLIKSFALLENMFAL